MLLSFNQKTAYELRISDGSSDVCSADLTAPATPTASQTKPTIGSTPASVASPALVNGNDSPASSSPRDSAAASPATRKRARELGVDITQVNPSAASGRLSRHDVERHASSGAPPPRRSADAAPPEQPKLIGLRRKNPEPM